MEFDARGMQPLKASIMGESLTKRIIGSISNQ